MKKRGFALIAAIFFIIIIATIAVTTLSTASMTARDTVSTHTREQAVLLAQSATEFAVMAMQSHIYNGENANIQQVNADGSLAFAPDGVTPIMQNIVGNNCLETINMTYPGYNITTNIYYIDSNLGCSAANDISGGVALAGGRTSHIALIDVTVVSNLGDLPPVRYNRRTLQKP